MNFSNETEINFNIRTNKTGFIKKKGQLYFFLFVRTTKPLQKLDDETRSG